MGWFTRKEPVDADFLVSQLADIAPFTAGKLSVKAGSAPAGFKHRSLTTVAEFTVDNVTGWFRRDELADFFAGRIHTVESWNGSAHELFLATIHSLPKSSAAYEALDPTVRKTASDHAVLFVQAPQGLTPLMTYDRTALEALEHWNNALPTL